MLGAGPAGLACGVWARRAGLSVRLLEARERVGGNAVTFAAGPFRYDSGAHRLHRPSPAVAALVDELAGDLLHPVDAPSRVLWRGRRLRFPPRLREMWSVLGPGLSLRALGEVLAARAGKSWGAPPDSFAALATARYGPSLARFLLLDYSEKLWGLPATRLAPEVAGGRLRGLDLRGALRGLLGLAPRHLDGRFLYPRGGFGALSERLADAIGSSRIALSAPVQRLLHDGRRIRAVEVGGRKEPVREVASSLPLPGLLARLDPPLPALQSLAAGLRFRHLVLLALFLDRPRVGPDASLYFPDPALPFTRVVEPKNRCASLAPPTQTALVVELPCGDGDGLWTAEEEEVRARVLPELEAWGLVRPEELLGSRLHRLPRAYPVLERGSGALRERLRRGLARLENLHLVGRNAGFVYGHVHDWLEQGRRLAEWLRRRRPAGGERSGSSAAGPRAGAAGPRRD